MVKVLTNKINFSSKGPFALWDWEDSKQPYIRDFDAKVYFFIKDKNPRAILKEFIKPLKNFNFKADLEG